MKVAIAGKAIGYWDGTANNFQFKLPSGVFTADITFVGTSGVHKFYFSSNAANDSHVKWEDMDYDFDNEAFLLDRAFTRHGKCLPIVELPLPRVLRCTEYHNSTRPSHLVGGSLVRCRRSYSQSEFRPVGRQDLEQSPAYFTRRTRSVSRTPIGQDPIQGAVQDPIQDPILTKEVAGAGHKVGLHL